MAQAEVLAPISVAGYIDAITGNRIFGWAWDRERPDARIAIRLQHKGEVIATVAADRPREDLAANGLGDGAHAFEVALPEGISPNEVKVEAVCPGSGRAVPLGSKDAPAGQALPETKHMLEAVVRSQRQLARQVAAVADRLPDGETASVPPAELATRLGELERTLARIDASLAAIVPGQKANAQLARSSTDRALLVAAVGLGLMSLLLGAANLLI
jgi:hypothetical protein